MRLSNDVSCHNLTDSSAGGRTSIDRTTNGSYVATNDRSNQTRIDLFPSNQTNVCRFNHRISSLDHCDQAATFHQSKCFRHIASSSMNESAPEFSLHAG